MHRNTKDKIANSRFRVKQLLKYTFKIFYTTGIVIATLKLIGIL